MPMETITKNIILNTRGSSDTVQTLIEGDMIVPDINPDIAQLLRADEKIILDNIRCEHGRINVSGRVCISMLYYGQNQDVPVNAMTAELPIEETISFDGITEDTAVDIVEEIIHTDYRIVNDRKINAKIVIGLTPSWTKTNSLGVVTSIEGGEGVQSQTKVVRSTVSNERIAEEFSYREELRLPSGNPDISEILETTVEIFHRDIRVLDSTTAVKGDFRINIVYIGADEDYTVFSAEFMVPFSGNIDVPGASDNTVVMARIVPISISAEITSDDDGAPRSVDVDIKAGTVIKMLNGEEYTILEDAYSLGETLGLERESVEYMELGGRNKARGTFREILSLDSSQPAMMQIVNVCGRLRSTGISVTNDMVTINGVADMNVLYVAEDDLRPINEFASSIPFTQGVEIRGITQDTLVDVSMEIDDISFSMISSNEAEARVMVNFDVIAYENRQDSVITGVWKSTDESDTTKKCAAVIYTVKPGDSLWKIAKKFNTTIDEIVSLNKIENPDLIYPGERFLILKKFL